ncbi:hypothetical protein J6590_084729 [Homalodisca vitripennis]|nr:hypothetical protein J6590_084729 [Homalodisca vitripennis]
MTVVVNDESKHSTFSRINIVICFIPCGGPTVICFIPCGSRAADPLDGHPQLYLGSALSPATIPPELFVTMCVVSNHFTECLQLNSISAQRCLLQQFHLSCLSRCTLFPITSLRSAAQLCLGSALSPATIPPELFVTMCVVSNHFTECLQLNSISAQRCLLQQFHLSCSMSRRLLKYLHNSIL